MAGWTPCRIAGGNKTGGIFITTVFIHDNPNASNHLGSGTNDLIVCFTEFTKTFDGDTAPTGTPNLTFSIRNSSGTETVSQISFTDDLAAVIPRLVATGLPKNDVCGAGSQISGTSFLAMTGGSLGLGESCDITVPASAEPRTYTNTTSEPTSAGLTLSPAASADLLVNPPPTFAKTFSPRFIGLGQTSTVEFVIDNSGSTIAANNLAFTDNLPAGVVVADNPGASTTCAGGSITAVAESGSVSFAGGSVGAGTSCAVNVDVVGAAVGTQVNTTGELTSSLGNRGTASATLIVPSPPVFTKSFVPASLPAMQLDTPIAVLFTIDNTASPLTAENIGFSDDIGPARIANPTDASSTCVGGVLVAEAGTQTINYSGGSLPGGQTCRIRVDILIDSAGVYVNTTENLTSSLGDSGPRNFRHVFGGVFQHPGEAIRNCFFPLKPFAVRAFVRRRGTAGTPLKIRRRCSRSSP